jgi:protein-L-isoaspartate(D-aspartate) O-methyltransferase
MVAEQIRARGVEDPRVLAAMEAVPRHRFLPPERQAQAYADTPLPIGRGQTLSQPYIVAFMAQALELKGPERVLEIGSGCGYMAAVLARLAQDVYGVELEPELHRAALRNLEGSGVHLRCGDGAQGWPQAAPFDAVLFSCALAGIPSAVWEQVKEGGGLLAPLGYSPLDQTLMLIRKAGDQAQVRPLLPVTFVPFRQPPQ